jgi:hypothetical protein
MKSLILRALFPTFVMTALLPVSAWTQDSFEYRQHKGFLDSMKFDSAICLWSLLDDNTRLAYYNQSVYSASNVLNNFESLKAKCLDKIKEHQKNLDKLEDEEKEIKRSAKFKSLVIVGQSEREEHSELYGVTGPFGATYSRPLYHKELSHHSEELYDISEGKTKSQNALINEQSKIRASAALSADAAEQSANEADYILALQEAVEEETQSSVRFHTLETVDSSVVPSDKMVNVVFDTPGRILVRCGGSFKVRVVKEGTGKVTGIGDAMPAYRRFCIIDAKAGDAYSVRVHAEAPISVVIEEVR